MTTGDLMAGSVVTVYFTDTSSSSAVWAATGAGAGAATGAGWSLSQSGDTFSNAWTLLNSGNLGILSFRFDGVNGNTVFDIVADPTLSPGSARGNDIGDADGPAGLGLDAFYDNQLSIAGTFYGDLYTRLTVGITGGGLAGGGSLTFVADTDNADADRGGITVPEPATLGLLGLGLVGLGLRRRRTV